MTVVVWMRFMFCLVCAGVTFLCVYVYGVNASLSLYAWRCQWRFNSSEMCYRSINACSTVFFYRVLAPCFSTVF